MNELKTLAAECAQASTNPKLDIGSAWCLLSKVADALDAYAEAQGIVACQKHGAIVETGCPACERAIQATPPPRAPITREALAKAIRAEGFGMSVDGVNCIADALRALGIEVQG